MNKKESEFQKLLEDKYGKGIVNELYKKGCLQAEKIRETNDNTREMASSHMDVLFSKLNKGDLNDWVERNYKDTNEIWDKKSWAFDFSGWIGSLGFDKEHLKKYMIVGLEPHVERYDFQIAYGLSDNAPGDKGKRFSIDPKKNNFVRCNDDSSLIWTNLMNILGSDNLISAVKEGNETALHKFLNQFYITDLCHFAPQCQAGEIYKIKDWSDVRSNVASKFLKHELEIINPEVVITQGIGVFFEVLKILEADSFISYIDDKVKLKSNIKMAEVDNIKVINLPHFGSKMMANTFWKKKGKLDEIRGILEKHQLIDFEV